MYCTIQYNAVQYLSVQREFRLQMTSDDLLILLTVLTVFIIRREFDLRILYLEPLFMTEWEQLKFSSIILSANGCMWRWMLSL